MLTSKQEKYQEVLSVAADLYRQNPDWITYFREVLGIDGVARKAFQDQDQLNEFEASAEFEEIQKMLTKLREKKIGNEQEIEPTRVITVRLPKSMHEFLQTEAHERKTSMNKLCISKLLQMIDNEKIPEEPAPSARSRRRSINRMNQANSTQAPAESSPATLSISNSVDGLG